MSHAPHQQEERSSRPLKRRTRDLCNPPRARTTKLQPPAAQPRYDTLVRDLKARYKISIRHWNTHMAGHAYELTYAGGTIKRLISAPRPKGPVSAAIFMHEVGHHAIGFRRYASRCLEEHYVWQWTFREMESHGIPITPRVMKHFRRSMYHYVHTAQKRREPVPPELLHFAHWPG